MRREQLFAAFFFAIFLFLLYQFYLVFHFFITPLSWGALLALVFYPVHRELVVRLRHRDGLAAFLLTTAIIAVVIVPTIYLTILLTNEAVSLVKNLREAAESGQLVQVFERLRASRPGQLWELHVGPLLQEQEIDIPSLAVKAGNAVSGFLVAQAGGAAANVLRFLGNFLFTTLALFFFFRDGEKMVQAFRDILPMQARHKDAILGRIYETLSAVVQGTAATAVAQGLLAGLAFWFLGVPFAVLLSCATAFFSLIPFGPPLVWLSVTGFLLFQGAYVKALIMFGWGIGAIGTADNVIRPLIIGGRTQIPTVFLFFGILGGLQAYGFLGLFLGPALIAVLVAFIRIYREEYGIGASTGVAPAAEGASVPRDAPPPAPLA